MSATHKKIYTKPSINDIWFFERDLLFGITNGGWLTTTNYFIENNINGYIGNTVLETVTVEELEARKFELKEIRPDLFDLIFVTMIQDPVDLKFSTIIEILKKNNLSVGFDPFTNIQTWIIEFDTWENLTSAYETVINDETFLNFTDTVAQYNTTIIEEFYVDEVKQDYTGYLTR